MNMFSAKSVYLAGPITGLSYGEAKNGWRAEFAKLLNVRAPHIECYSPMRSKEFLSDQQNLECRGVDLDKIEHALSRPLGILTRDANDVAQRDAVVACFLGATRVSIGTVWEIGYASAQHPRKPIIVVMEKGDSLQYPSPEDCAWLAALVDGEGNIFIQKRETTSRGGELRNINYQVRLAIAMKCKAVLDRVQSIVGLGVVNSTTRGLFSWKVTGPQAAVVLHYIFDRLIEKKYRAAIALEMASQIGTDATLPTKGQQGFQAKPQERADREAEIYDRYRQTFVNFGAGVPFTWPRPVLRANVHDHVFITHTSGYVVETLDEAAVIVGSLLTPGV